MIFLNTVTFLSSRLGSIVSAVIVAGVLVAGAWYLSQPHPSSVANAESTEELLKAYAAKDTDGDGLPDWEETLYGTDLSKQDTDGDGIGDAEAVKQGLVKLRIPAAPVAPAPESLAGRIPGATAATSTVTDQFARVFINNYLSTRGDAPPTQEDMLKFVRDSVQNLAQSTERPGAYASSAITVSGSGAAALRAYAAAVDQAFAAHATQLPYSELVYFADASEKGDANALKNLSAIAKSYTDTADAIAKVPVPKEAAAADLSLVNAMAALGGSIGDMAAVQTDPIRAMMGLAKYPQNAIGLVTALKTMKAVFDAADVSIEVGNAGSSFYKALISASTLQVP